MMKHRFLCVNYSSRKSWLHSVFLELCMMVLIYTLSFDSVLIQLTATQLPILTKLSSQNSFSKGGLAQLYNILERNHKDSRCTRQD